MIIYITAYVLVQGSKLTLANSQNASDFDNLRVRKISTSKRLRVRIIHVSQTKGNNLLVVSPVCQRKKILLAKLCKCTKKITSSPVVISHVGQYKTSLLLKQFGIIIRFWDLPTYPFPKPALTLTSHLTLCWLRGGVGGQFPRDV